MQSLKSSFSNIPYAFIFLLFSSVGIMQFYQGPLEDPIPSAEVDAGITPINGHQKIPARIWEDPFESAHNVLKTTARLTLNTTPENLITQLFAELSHKNESTQTTSQSSEKIKCDKTCLIDLKKKIHFYTIPLGVDGWSASQEARVKRRYAAHMALYRQGYIPAQSSSIHSLCLVHKSHPLVNVKIDHLAGDCWPHEYIHYEILTKTAITEEPTDEIEGGAKNRQIISEKVVLIWARNSQVSTDPAEFFLQLSSQLIAATKQVFDIGKTTDNLLSIFDFVAFWPPTSGGLSQIKNIPKTEDNNNICPQLTFRLVNYSATAPHSMPNNVSLYPIDNRSSDNNDSRQLTCDNQIKLHLTFDTVIANDSLVIDQLLDELFDQRGFSAQKSMFVLVTEWENIYSRKMAHEFQTRCKQRQPLGHENEECEILRFPYISGISGDSSFALNDAIIKTKETGLGGQKSNSSTKQQEIRLPIGSSQYDYIRRLTDYFNQRLMDSFIDKRNTVFALFGSNFDDKLLVLQAIRESNKESTIITTDMNVLYASLLKKFPIRNLIIGSSFSLNSEDKMETLKHNLDESKALKKKIFDENLTNHFSTIHFRDNYQTSLFRAITNSLTKQEGLLLNDEEIKNNIRLYEVGKSKFIVLNKIPSNKSIKSAEQSLFGSIKQSKDYSILLQNIIAPIFMVAMLMILVWATESLYKHAEFNKPGALAAFERTILKALGPNVFLPKKIGAMLVSYVIFFCLIFITFALAGRFTVESPLLFSGISIWISEAGRALAVIFILFSVTVSWSKLTRWRDRISHRYVNQVNNKIVTYWKPWVSTNNKLLTKKEEHIFNRIQFEKSWHLFRNELCARNIFIKSCYFLSAFILLGAWVYTTQYDGLTNIPAHPIARGNIAVLYDRFFAGLSNTLLILQIAYVLVVTYVCGRLVSHLSRGIIEWPQVYINKLKDEYQKQDDTIIKCCYSEYHGIKLIGNLTSTIGPQVVVPFVAIFLIVVTRNTYFDNWNYPASFLFFFSISGVALLVCATWLRSLATRAKKYALERLTIQKTRYLNDSEKSRQVDHIIELIHQYQKGAFSGWKDNPLVAAIMLPISSIIGINVMPW